MEIVESVAFVEVVGPGAFVGSKGRFQPDFEKRVKAEVEVVAVVLFLEQG